MAEEVTKTSEQVTQTPQGAVRETRVATDSTAQRYSTAERVIQMITNLVLALLAVRVVLSLLGANRSNAFAEFIYGITYPFVTPFFGLFGYNMQYGVARLELETLMAMVIYALVGYGLARLVSIGRQR